MVISLALATLVVISGTIATYLYEREAPLSVRLCEGACVGFAVLGLVAFVIASLVGLTSLPVFLTAIVLAVSFVLLLDKQRRQALRTDFFNAFRFLKHLFQAPDRRTLGYVFFYCAAAAVFWRIFNRAVIVTSEGMFTGLLNNFGDLPFHVSVITSFAFGNNFPPQDPTYAGVSFTYPFLTDFISAIFVRTGLNLRESMFIENFILALAFVGLLHRWALVMLRDRLAAIATPIIVLLNGGFGWILLWQQSKASEQGLYGALKNLPPSFTIIPDTVWRWGNAISTLLVPQRGMLLGLPLAVIVFTHWWLATEGERQPGDREISANQDDGKAKKLTKTQKKNAGHGKGGLPAPKRRQSLDSSHTPAPFLLQIRPWHKMAAAGVVAGLLPLVHAHSFIAVMGVGFFIGLLQRRWRLWAVFFITASLVAVPQMFWSTHQSAVDATKFFEWHLGWDRGKESAVWFWFRNTGLFIPLLVTAILWRGREYLVSKPLLFFYLPFLLCFLVPNVIKLAPWVWDNIKILYYWWLASAPLVALLLARLWRYGTPVKLLVIGLFCAITLAGALDVAAITLRSNRYEIFDTRGIRFSELVKQVTEPSARIVHAPVHNHPVFLTGRRSLMGYPGHIWTHGLEFSEREAEIRRIYSGAPDAIALLDKHQIEYAVVGPHERNLLTANAQFFERFRNVGEVGEYRLFKIKP